jgi:hypothetical protein
VGCSIGAVAPRIDHVDVLLQRQHLC